MKEKIIERVDETYGSVNYEFVAHIDYQELIRNVSFDMYRTWAKTYHPKNYFPAALFLNATDIGEAFDLYVCVDDINGDWDHLTWKQKHGFSGSRSKKLPVAISRKKLEKWKLSFAKLTGH